MRIRLSQLRRIIKEEVSRAMNEVADPAHEAFRALSGSYKYLDKNASEDQVEKINDFLEMGEGVYDSVDVMGMGSEMLNIQAQSLVNRAVKLGLKTFDEVGQYIEDNKNLADYTEKELAGHRMADLVYPPGSMRD